MKEFAIRWSTSRGQDTYGYTICTVVGEGLKGRCMGGGYDMLGTSFAHVIMQAYPAYFDGTIQHSDETIKSFYGMRRTSSGGFYLDGACGVDCVERVCKELIGVKVRWEYARDRKGRVTHRCGVVLED